MGLIRDKRNKSMNVSVLLYSLEPTCEAFVQRQQGAKICHLPAWSDLIARTVAHKVFYLVARDDQSVRSRGLGAGAAQLER